MNTAAGNCVLCSGTDAQVIEKCKKGFAVLKCLNCRLVYVSPLPQKELIESAHSDSYYAPWLKDQRSKRIHMWEKRLKRLNSLSETKGRLLDVGCAEGLFLELAAKDGWDVTGTEISHYAVRHGKEKLGMNVIQGELSDMKFSDSSFDAVTMWHVLEHTVNPIDVLREILFDPDDRELHLYHFTPETIRLASEKAGFTVQKIMPDMGIVQWHMKGLNHIAAAGSRIIGKIITDAIEIHLKPV
jgi:hypothetical protein